MRAFVTDETSPRRFSLPRGSVAAATASLRLLPARSTLDAAVSTLIGEVPAHAGNLSAHALFDGAGQAGNVAVPCVADCGEALV
jgi:hypothetical protein